MTLNPLSVTVNTTVTPATLTVKSDRRIDTVTVSAAGETATAKAIFPISISDSTSHVWTLLSDDASTATGQTATAVYNY
jgi:hypothetical protein